MGSRLPMRPPGVPRTLEDFLQRPAWRRDAARRGLGHGAFIWGEKADYAATRELCDGCPLRQECLETALADPDLLVVCGCLWAERRSASGGSCGGRRRRVDRHERLHRREGRLCRGPNSRPGRIGPRGCLQEERFLEDHPGTADGQFGPSPGCRLCDELIERLSRGDGGM
jgi:hypothetical protein